LFASDAAQALAGEFDAMRVVHEAVQNGVGVSGIPNDLVPVGQGGIVNLSEGLAEEMRFFVEVGSGSSARLGDLAPSGKGSPARSAAEVSSGEFGIRDVEEVRDLIVNRQKPLCLLG
jgi:hypothetical protein